MSLFGALKGKLHKKSLDEEIQEAFGEKEPYSKKVLEASKNTEGENDPEYNKFAGRTASSFQQKRSFENESLDPSMKLRQTDELMTPLPARSPPLQDPPIPTRQAEEPTHEAPAIGQQNHAQLASKIQALQKRHAMQPVHEQPLIQQDLMPQHMPAHAPSQNSTDDLLSEIRELKEQNKNIVAILRDIQKNLRI